jgi:hypothetical protein
MIPIPGRKPPRRFENKLTPNLKKNVAMTPQQRHKQQRMTTTTRITDHNGVLLLFGVSGGMMSSGEGVKVDIN